MQAYRATVVHTNDIEHHGVKGQKWGVKRYKEARATGVAANRYVEVAKLKEALASRRYERKTAKMYKSMYKRDSASAKMDSAKPNSRKAYKYAGKKAKYKVRVENMANKRNEAKNSVINARKDAARYKNVYKSAVQKAAKEKVYIQDHTEAKHLMVAAANSYAAFNDSKGQITNPNAFKTANDTFDDEVMKYRNTVRR